MIFSRSFGARSSRYPRRDGTPLKYQMCVTGAASSMWPIRSRRTLALVTSTPQRSQMMPLNRTRLYLPVALPVPGGAEDLLAEEPVLLRLEGAVVDGLRLLHLAVGPLPDVFSGGQADAEVVEEVDV